MVSRDSMVNEGIDIINLLVNSTIAEAPRELGTPNVKGVALVAEGP